LYTAAQETGGNLGGAGLIEMPNARLRRDGTLEASAAIRRQRDFYALSLQALPWMQAVFRVADRLNATTGRGNTTDRSFDLRIRLWEEDDFLPALAVGLQDLAGTGIYAGEYLVASRRIGPVDVTIGMGWGRLGSAGDVTNPLSVGAPGFRRRPRDVGQGGRPDPRVWFRGPEVALFGGVELQVPGVENVRLKLEYSGDERRDERRRAGEAGSRINAGVQWSDEHFDAGIFFVHGTDVLFRLSARFDAGAPPRAARPDPPRLTPRLREADGGALGEALAAQGFRLLALDLNASEAVIAFTGGRFRTLAQTVGRVLRAAQPALPARIEHLTLAWWRDGVEIARVQLLREAMEAASLGHGSYEEVFATARLLRAGNPLPRGGAAPGLGLDWGIEPRLRLSFGDPRETLLYQASLVGGARVALGAGFAIVGGLQHAFAQNLDRAAPSDSQLPRVRSEAARYAMGAEHLAIPALYTERIWAPALNVFARATVGYLEPMFAGVSGEVLWRPNDQPFAIGLDLAWVRQRAFEQDARFRRYTVTTGHLSLHADLPLWNLHATVRAGRYLAGDWGATLELSRRFDSGVEVGAFATLTDAPFRMFGEGSFDKGIFLRIPLDLFGVESRSSAGATIRPVQRDGGQRLAVDNPLYELTRDGRADDFRRGAGEFLR
jgi:hypothetical protein